MTAGWTLEQLAEENASLRRQLLELEDERAACREQVLRCQRLRVISRLANDAVHDFNNLLVGIRTLADLIKLGAEPGSELHAHASLIEDAGRRTFELARLTLGLARRTAGSDRTTELSNVLMGLETILGFSLEKRVRLEVSGTACPVTVHGPRAHLEHAILEVLENARLAMPEGGCLSLGLERITLEAGSPRLVEGMAPGDYAVLSVSDTGSGMSPDVLARACEPFFTTRPGPDGAGLGLALAEEIVRGLEGGLELDSEVGKGTTVRLVLPCCGGRGSEPEPVPARPPARGQGRILVVDDEPIVRLVAGKLLGILGYRVVEAEGGRAAVEYLRTHPGEIDLVFLDVTMPDMTGHDCLLALREVDPEIRVLLSSGLEAEAPPVRAAMAEGAGFVRKPYDVAQVSAAVAEALARPVRG